VVDLTADLRTSHPHTLSLAALAALAAETALRLRSAKLGERLRERWETVITRRRTPSAGLESNGRVIASQGMGELPSRLEAAPEPDQQIVLPDGRLGQLEPLDGGGAILWLRRRSQSTHSRSTASAARP
jgi:hypothetical protein